MKFDLGMKVWLDPRVSIIRGLTTCHLSSLYSRGALWFVNQFDQAEDLLSVQVSDARTRWREHVTKAQLEASQTGGEKVEVREHREGTGGVPFSCSWPQNLDWEHSSVKLYRWGFLFNEVIRNPTCFYACHGIVKIENLLYPCNDDWGYPSSLICKMCTYQQDLKKYGRGDILALYSVWITQSRPSTRTDATAWHGSSTLTRILISSTRECNCHSIWRFVSSVRRHSMTCVARKPDLNTLIQYSPWDHRSTVDAFWWFVVFQSIHSSTTHTYDNEVM